MVFDSHTVCEIGELVMRPLFNSITFGIQATCAGALAALSASLLYPHKAFYTIHIPTGA